MAHSYVEFQADQIAHIDTVLEAIRSKRITRAHEYRENRRGPDECAAWATRLEELRAMHVKSVEDFLSGASPT
ncbi:MAG: hypothetical protein AB1749_00520 [Pseudomonadota bacterium]